MEEGITNRQLFFVIIISVIGFCAVKLPKIMGKAAGTGAWLPLLVAAAFFAVNILIIVYLGQVYRGKSLFEYSQLLTGKVVSYLFCIIYTVYFFIFLAFIVRSSADIIKAEILYKTPIWATMLLILAVALLAASKGLTNLGRIIEYLGMLLLVTSFVLQFITLTQGNLLNTLPIFDHTQAGRYARALPSTIFCFLGFEMITVVPFSKRNGKKAMPTAALAIFVLVAVFILILESCYSVIGVEDIVNYDYPLLNAIRRLDIAALQFAKRLDLFFIMAWLASIFCSVSMVAFTAAEYAKKLIPKLNRGMSLLIIGVGAFFIGMAIPNAEDVSDFFQGFLINFGLIPAFLIPVILLIVHLIKQKMGKSPTSNSLAGGGANG